MNCLISIIIPCYNVANYLQRCLDALLSQTYSNLQIICIDDGSDDDTLAILNTYSKQDSRIQVLTSSNLGPAHARNMGLSLAKGEFLMFCDADDWYSPSMCQEMLTTILREKVDLVMCGTNVHFTTTNKKLCAIKKDAVAVRMTGIRTLDNKLRRYVNVFLWNKIFRRQLIEQTGLSFPDGCEYDDCSFVQQYLCVAKQYFGLTDKLYEHIVRDNSITDLEHKNQRPERRFEHIATFHHTLNFLMHNNLRLKSAQYFLYVFFWSVKFFDWQFFQTREEKISALVRMKAILCHFSPIEIFRLSNLVMFCIRIGFFWPVILSFDLALQKKS